MRKHQGFEAGGRRGLQGALQLGPLGQGRPDRHAEPRDARRHRDAAKLIKRGKSFALGLPLTEKVRARPVRGRWNPIHTCSPPAPMRGGGPGGKAYCYADDAINMPMQCSTQWDSLGTSLSTTRCTTATQPRCGLERRKAKRHRAYQGQDGWSWRPAGCGALEGLEALADGYGITNDDLDGTARRRGWKSARATSYRADGTEGVLPRARGLGGICGRRCAGPHSRPATGSRE